MLDRFYRRRNAAYREVFGLPGKRSLSQERVLADLADACGVNREMVTPGDPFGTTANASKFRVWQRIQNCINMGDGEVRDIQRQRQAEMAQEAAE